MKWDKYTIETTTEAEDYISSTLADLGIEGIEIEDNVPLSESDTSKMFIDILPELPPDQGIGYVSFYLESGEDHSEKLKEVADWSGSIRRDSSPRPSTACCVQVCRSAGMACT